MQRVVVSSPNPDLDLPLTHQPITLPLNRLDNLSPLLALFDMVVAGSGRNSSQYVPDSDVHPRPAL